MCSIIFFLYLSLGSYLDYRESLDYIQQMTTNVVFLR